MFANRRNLRALKEIGVEEHDGDAYLWPNRQNSRVLKEIGVEEHDGDVRF